MPLFAPEFVRLKLARPILISSRARKRSTVLNRHAIYSRHAARYQRADEATPTQESSLEEEGAGTRGKGDKTAFIDGKRRP